MGSRKAKVVVDPGEGFFTDDTLAELPVGKRQSGPPIPAQSYGVRRGNLKPDPGRTQTVNDHTINVALTDRDGNSYGQHVAVCDCGWRQERFNPMYMERTSWAEAMDHALGTEWRDRRVLIEPPFENDSKDKTKGKGKGDPTYLANIVEHYGALGEYDGPYLLITQNCQQSKALESGEDTAHNCLGVIFGRGDEEADDRMGICVDSCHNGIERRLCGGLQDNGCREIATMPDDDLPPTGNPEQWMRTPERDLVLCDSHWLATRRAAAVSREMRQGDGLRAKFQIPDYLDEFYDLMKDPRLSPVPQPGDDGIKRVKAAIEAGLKAFQARQTAPAVLANAVPVYEPEDPEFEPDEADLEAMPDEDPDLFPEDRPEEKAVLPKKVRTVSRPEVVEPPTDVSDSGQFGFVF